MRWCSDRYETSGSCHTCCILLCSMRQVWIRRFALVWASILNVRELPLRSNCQGWIGCRLFLAMNGVQLAFVEDGAFELVMDIARGTLVDVEKIAGVVHGWMPS